MAAEILQNRLKLLRVADRMQIAIHRLLAEFLALCLVMIKYLRYWKRGLNRQEDIDFKYTTMSLHDVYETSFKHALQNIERNGGTINADNVIIKLQQPVAVKFEKSFDGQYPVAMIPVKWNEDKDEISFDFDGIGFVLKGDASRG